MLYVNPTALGRGSHLFGQIRRALQLELLETRTFNSGVVLMCYRPIYGA
jgi:hypothetical protein